MNRRQPNDSNKQVKPPHVGVVVGYVFGLLVILGVMWVIAVRVL